MVCLPGAPGGERRRSASRRARPRAALRWTELDLHSTPAPRFLSSAAHGAVKRHQNGKTGKTFLFQDTRATQIRRQKKKKKKTKKKGKKDTLMYFLPPSVFSFSEILNTIFFLVVKILDFLSPCSSSLLSSLGYNLMENHSSTDMRESKYIQHTDLLCSFIRQGWMLNLTFLPT